MNKTILLLMFLMLLMAASVFTPKSQAFTAGVQVGNWFRYKGTLVYWRADEGVPFPPHQYANIIREYNETDWYLYNITDIVATSTSANVTFQVTRHWKNGTEDSYTLVDNMTSSFTMMVIDTDLGPGDMVRPLFDWTEIFGFPYVWPARYLNETIEVEYVGGTTRYADVLDWWIPGVFGPPTTRQIYWWDNTTGIQVRYEVRENGTDFVSGGAYEYIATFELIDSSYGWGAVIPEYPKWPLVLLTLTVTAAIPVALYKRKLRLR